MKQQYGKPEIVELGGAADLTKSQNLSNADDLGTEDSANPFIPPTNGS